MKKLNIVCVLALLMITFTTAGAKKTKNIQSSLYVVATDYVKANGQTDVADALQKLIDENPGKTIFFPDGVYMLSHSLDTPADPRKSVHLMLANFAVLKAMTNWQGGALVRLGARIPFNSIEINGSNYGIEGGIFDGSNIADGISIDSGRETRVNHVSIKHVKLGLWIKTGANSGSSDSDIMDVNIVGNNEPNSIGLLIEGCDNHFSDMRIASVNIGVWCKSGGNSFKNIHPLYIFGGKQDYESSIGFRIDGENTWFDYCYSDQFATAFKLKSNVSAHFNGCWAWWYKKENPKQVAIECDGPLNAYFYGMRYGYKGGPKTLLKAEKGGKGCIQNSRIPNVQFTDDDVSTSYIKK